MTFRRAARKEAARDTDQAGLVPTDQSKVPATRTSATHAGLVGGLIFLALLLVFIIQNLQSVSVHFITARFRLPVGVVLVLAAVIGGALVSGASLVRIAQLRRRARRQVRERDDAGRRKRR